MAAFLYRLAGSPEYTAPSTSPFNDVTTSTPHYKEICWLANTKISTGWDYTWLGKFFCPYYTVARADMAAFLYRLAGSPSYTAPSTSPFKDINSSTSHYKEICWLVEKGVSTGWNASGGKEFRPYSTVARCDMAAFLHRMKTKGLVNAPHVHSAKLYVYGSGDGVPVYSASHYLSGDYTGAFIFAKTDYADEMDLSQLTLDATDGSASASWPGSSNGTNYVSDIELKNGSSDVYDINRVDGGLVARVTFGSAGKKTLRLKENGVVIATLTIDVADYQAAVDAWENKVLASVTNSSMNSYQKMTAVQNYCMANFRYKACDSSMKTLLNLAQYWTPFWVSYRVDSCIAPYVLYDFAVKIGGLNPHNCYAEGNWRVHGYITVEWEGETSYVSMGQGEISSTGIIESWSNIDFTDLKQVQHFNSGALRGREAATKLSGDTEEQSLDDGATPSSQNSGDDSRTFDEAGQSTTDDESAEGDCAAVTTDDIGNEPGNVVTDFAGAA